SSFALPVPPSESYTHPAIQSINPSVFQAVYFSRSPMRDPMFWQNVVVCRTCRSRCHWRFQALPRSAEFHPTPSSVLGRALPACVGLLWRRVEVLKRPCCPEPYSDTIVDPRFGAEKGPTARIIDVRASLRRS